ncbi:uncharacterized protein GIQ15_05688 [Arthroderma uncinatum]|uniref:uncharacterized protein n=1 Tax=Arthroderma uncinatum TaxID=74035 RepID=UPI00144A9CBD|nr:uncharacterized protein GIQ15_05688 [Arthroderma uncinatum]KAF3480341.1 hypothetical protein GIQ15_05688 [Arthroderma uncinatum]
MAFRLPDQTPQRQRPFPKTSRSSTTTPPNVPQSSVKAEEEDSQEWVLFSPVEAQSTVTHSHTTSTERTPRTAGLSRLSDFGSLDTAAQSSGPLQSERSDVEADQERPQEGVQDDDVTELDSLDDGLHAFREPQLDQSGGPALLPTHDGLGTFEPSGLNVQERLWQHEQFNPRRVGETRQRSRSSVQRHLDNVNEAQGLGMEQERWQRIEQWRMEQSRVLLQEIEKETRRRKQRKRRSKAKGPGTLQHPQPTTSNDTMESSSKADSPFTDNEAELNATLDTAPNDDTDSDESFWQRITRRVINGLIGIDDSLLAVIFGEALVSDTKEQDENASSQTQMDGSLVNNKYKRFTTFESDDSENVDEAMRNVMSSSTRADWWQERLLERIARELGILVHQIYEHPRAFTAYMRTNIDPSAEYAGIPISQPTTTPNVSATASRRPSYISHENGTSILSPTFIPTLQDTAASKHAALWGIEEDAPHSFNGAQKGTGTINDLSESERRERDREYWERELNIKMVFRYLRSRFAASATGNTSINNTNTDPTSPQHKTQRQRQHDPIRAAIIRQHHPLVARAEANSRFHHHQSPRIYRHHSHMRGAASSSCASQSQSTRKSVSTKRTIAGGSGSSRHYWDIGGSAGSSSAPLAVGGGMGSWGDV